MEGADDYRAYAPDVQGSDAAGGVSQPAYLTDEVFEMFNDSPELGLLAKKTGFVNQGQIEDLVRNGSKQPALGLARGAATKTSLFPVDRTLPSGPQRRYADGEAAAVLSSLPSSPTKLAPSSASSAAALLAAAAAAASESIGDDPRKGIARRKKDDLGDDFSEEDHSLGKRRKLTPSGAPMSTVGGYHMPVEEVRAPGDKNKGLRLFSKVVCDKVMQKQVTSYNEVADELVMEYTNQAIAEGNENPLVDQKNIRRRVYDALNVLMAMNIISKEKKEIKWIGLPATSPRDEMRTLSAERQQVIERLRRKKEQLEDLEAQYELYSRLIKRNEAGGHDQNERILVPFIVVHTPKQTLVDCVCSDDFTEYLIKFEQPFSIHDDNEILRRVLANDSTRVPLPSAASSSSTAAAASLLVPNVSSSAAASAPSPAAAPTTQGATQSTRGRRTRRAADAADRE